MPPPLALTDLARLPGAPDENFEALTRSIVSRRYGALGVLRERRQQPGVEFYLVVQHQGPLGAPGRVWGWSCKWFMLSGTNALTKGQRQQILDSVDKALEHVNGLTDFVLCLPLRPTKKDEAWIADELAAGRSVSVRLWAPENFDAELAGYDELRSTFFGELALTPDQLAKTHERSLAPVRARWVPDLHAANHVEQRLGRALLRPSSFTGLQRHIDAIDKRAAILRRALAAIPDEAIRAAAERASADLHCFLRDAQAAVDAARAKRPSEAQERLRGQRPPTTPPTALRALTVALRRLHSPASLGATGIGAEVRDAMAWVKAAN